MVKTSGQKDFLRPAKQVTVATGITSMNISLRPQKIKGISLRREEYIQAQKLRNPDGEFTFQHLTV